MSPTMQPYLQPPFPLPPVPGTVQQGPFRLPATHDKFFTYVHRFQTGAAQGPLTGAAGTVARDSVMIDGDSDFFIRKMALFQDAFTAEGASDGPFFDNVITFELTPLSEQVTFPKSFLSGIGNGQLPTVIAPAYWLKRNAIWSAIVEQRSLMMGATDTQTILVAHHGIKRYPRVIRDQRLYARARWFVYIMSFTDWDAFQNGGDIAAAGTVIGQVRTDGDSDFVVQKIVALSDTPIQFQIETDNDQWSNLPVRFDLVGGTNPQAPGVGTNLSGWYPFILPGERFVGRAQTITARVANLDTVDATRVQLQFWGTRYYDR